MPNSRQQLQHTENGSLVMHHMQLGCPFKTDYIATDPFHSKKLYTNQPALTRRGIFSCFYGCNSI